MGVGQLVPLGGHHGLLAVVGRGGAPAAAGTGKKVHDLLPFCFIKVQGIAKGFGHGLLGQVVLRGAKPAGKHQQIAAAFGFLYQITQAARVIPNHMLVQHADAQFR